MFIDSARENSRKRIRESKGDSSLESDYKEDIRDSCRETRESFHNREYDIENQRSKPSKSSTRHVASHLEKGFTTSPEQISSKSPISIEDRLGSGKVNQKNLSKSEARVKSGKRRPVSGKSRPLSSRAKSRQELQRPESQMKSRSASQAGSRVGSWVER